MRWLKNALRFVANLLLGEVFGPYVLPSLGAALVFASGFISQVPVPLPYLLAGMAVTFAAISHSILKVMDIRIRTALDGKLRFGNPPPIAMDAERNEDGKLLIKKIQAGVQVQNIASFALQYEILEFYFEFDHKVPKGDHPIQKVHTLDPQQGNTFMCAPVDCNSDMAPNTPIFGKINYHIRYWRKGRKKTINIAKKESLEVSIGADGTIKVAIMDKTQDASAPTPDRK